MLDGELTSECKRDVILPGPLGFTNNSEVWQEMERERKIERKRERKLERV